MATQRERIGFIGLGSMGRPMATSLVRKGFAVTAFDTVPARISALVEGIGLCRDLINTPAEDMGPSELAIGRVGPYQGRKRALHLLVAIEAVGSESPPERDSVRLVGIRCGI